MKNHKEKHVGNKPNIQGCEERVERGQEIWSGDTKDTDT